MQNGLQLPSLLRFHLNALLEIQEIFVGKDSYSLMSSELHSERTYRQRISRKDLCSFQVSVKETDLWICAETTLETEARNFVHQARHQIETYIRSHPLFLTSLTPLEVDPFAPSLIKEMQRVTGRAGVGPMAAVAGAIAQYVGEGLLTFSEQIIVENGGDIFLKENRSVTVSIFAGESPFSEKIGIQIHSDQMPTGICSSSATVGHSLSMGVTDVVCLLSPSAALADAAATSLGNRVKKKAHLNHVNDWADQIGGITGGVVIVGDRMATWGNIELVAL